MKIPNFEMPGMINGVNFIDEELVDIEDYFGKRIITLSQHYDQKIEGATDRCLVRETLIKKLEIAIANLPEHITLAVYDAWRPINVQKYVYNSFYNKYKAENKDMSEEKLHKLIKQYIAEPSDDIDNPSPHNSGGAIDLTLFDLNTNAEMNLGTRFNSISKKAKTDYYETAGSDEARVNRRTLYAAMINAGFTNLPSMWWHYDYGDAFWSYYTGKKMLYRGIPN